MNNQLPIIIKQKSSFLQSGTFFFLNVLEGASQSTKDTGCDTFSALDYHLTNIGWIPPTFDLPRDQSRLKSSRDWRFVYFVDCEPHFPKMYSHTHLLICIGYVFA